jgi:hypothetical protein
MRHVLFLFTAMLLAAAPAGAQEDEIVANLAGGRALILVTKDAIIFGAIDHPLESKSVPPRVGEIGSTHVGILFGASEWQAPAQPRPIRLDRDVQHVYAADPRYRQSNAGEGDLEQIGIGYLEKLRPLVAQLHHKIDLKPDEPLFEIVLIGLAPAGYGPEVWTIAYHVEQQIAGAQADYWQTRIQRPRFTQLYPPEKHEARTLVEVRFPETIPDIPLLGLIQQNDPRMARLRASDARFAKVADLIEHGQAQKANSKDAVDFLGAALPLVAGGASFILATLDEGARFQWIVPPREPVEKQQAEDKNRPPDAPTLRRKPNP